MASSPPPLACVELPLQRYSPRDALDHDVLVTVSSFLDTSLQLTLSQAAMKGHRYLMERMAHRQPFDELDPFFRQWIYTKAMACAAERGDLGFVQWLTRSFPGCFVTAAVEAAAKSGNLSILQWLHAHHDDVKWGADEMFWGLHNNHVKVAQWLYENVPELAEQDRRAAAAESGNVELLKWANSVWPSGWPSDNAIIYRAMAGGSVDVVKFVMENQLFERHTFGNISLDLAAEYGHLEVLKWMVEINAGQCTWDDLDGAAYSGQFDVIRWIIENRSEGFTTQPIDNLCTHGNLEIVRWVSENLPGCFSEEAMDLAALHGHLDIVRYLHESRTEGCTSGAMDNAASEGHLEVVKFLHNNRSEGCSVMAIEGAAGNGHLDVIQWLLANRHEGSSDRAIMRAAENGHLQVIEWLYENTSEGCQQYAMDLAAGNGHLEVVKWLHTNLHLKGESGSWGNPLDLAIGCGHIDVCRWLLASQSQRCTSAAYYIAAMNRQFEPMLVLRSEFNLRPQDSAFRSAMMYKELEILQWLLYHFPDEVDEATLRQTPFTRGVYIENWLRESGHVASN